MHGSLDRSSKSLWKRVDERGANTVLLSGKYSFAQPKLSTNEKRLPGKDSSE